MDDDAPLRDSRSPEDREDTASLDAIYDALSERSCRYVLQYLVEHPTATLERLTDVVAGMEASATNSVVTPTEHDRIRIRLYHSVLPKLDALEFVAFDPSTRTVSRATIPSRVRDLLEVED